MVELIGELAHALAELLALHVEFGTRRGDGAQEARQRHAGNLDGSLEREEHARETALVGGEIGDVLAAEHDGAAVTS